jgi:hypothetical protein
MPREFSLLGWTCSDRRRRVRGLPAHEQRFPGSTRRWPWGVSELQGEVKLRVWTPEDGGEKWFWGECGSALFGSNPARPEPIGIRMGTFDEDPGVRPSVRQLVAYAAPWEPIPDDGLPRFSHSRHGSGAGDRAGSRESSTMSSSPQKG